MQCITGHDCHLFLIILGRKRCATKWCMPYRMHFTGSEHFKNQDCWQGPKHAEICPLSFEGEIVLKTKRGCGSNRYLFLKIIWYKNYHFRVYFDLARINLLLLAYAPGHVKTEETCKRVVSKKAYTLKYVPDHLKTQAMCEKAVEDGPCMLKYEPDNLKTQEMRGNAVRDDPYTLKNVPNCLKVEKICKKVVEKNALPTRPCPWSFQDRIDLQ